MFFHFIYSEDCLSFFFKILGTFYAVLIMGTLCPIIG